MIRWLIVVFLALVFVQGLTKLLPWIGLGKLPGDFRFRAFGREWYVPLASTIVLSLVLSWLMKWV